MINCMENKLESLEQKERELKEKLKDEASRLVEKLNKEFLHDGKFRFKAKDDNSIISFYRKKGFLSGEWLVAAIRVHHNRVEPTFMSDTRYSNLIDNYLQNFSIEHGVRYGITFC